MSRSHVYRVWQSKIRILREMEGTCLGGRLYVFAVASQFDVIDIVFITEDVIVFGHGYFNLFEEIVNNCSVPQ